MVLISIVSITVLAPVSHPNKPLSDALKARLRKKAYISIIIWSSFTMAFFVLENFYISFCSAYGMITISGAMIAEVIKLRREAIEEK